jgi:succinoglycan biosynthesis protein ExoM
MPSTANTLHASKPSARGGAADARDAAATISIVIPTQRRPAGLMTAARSAFRLAGVNPARLELVIADNDQTPSAETLARTLADEAPFPVRYVHEPAAGVSNARNAAMSAARGGLIAFLDDDNEAEPGWLAALLEAQDRFGADIVFGPVRGRAPAAAGPHADYLRWFFSCEGPAEAGVSERYYGCRGALVRRAAMPDPAKPFCASRNQSGGEDDKLFETMRKGGARIAWTPEAVIFEDPTPDRLRLSYALARAFTYGQSPTQVCMDARPPRLAGAAYWMAVGLAQALVFGTLAAAQWIVRAPDRAFMLDRAVRGLGKVFFGGPFVLRFYGRSAPAAS